MITPEEYARLLRQQKQDAEALSKRIQKLAATSIGDLTTLLTHWKG